MEIFYMFAMVAGAALAVVASCYKLASMFRAGGGSRFMAWVVVIALCFTAFAVQAAEPVLPQYVKDGITSTFYAIKNQMVPCMTGDDRDTTVWDDQLARCVFAKLAVLENTEGTAAVDIAAYNAMGICVIMEFSGDPMWLTDGTFNWTQCLSVAAAFEIAPDVVESMMSSSE